MIPKKIHYCWFGGKPLNALGRRCLDSWKTYFPDYEIICWDESNSDLTGCRYVREAYEAGKWAFVSDYVRFKVLYEQGGLYFDTDVEVIRPFDDLLSTAGAAFMGCENPAGQPLAVNPGLGFAAEAGHALIGELLDDYEHDSFCRPDGTPELYTVVERVTALLRRHGLEDAARIQDIAGVRVYPTEYFCPIDMNTGKMRITENTHSIHRFAASWEKPANRLRGKIYMALRRCLGEKAAEGLRRVVGRKGDKRG